MEIINNITKYLQSIIQEKILNNIPQDTKLEKKKINGTVIYKSPEVLVEKYNISRCLYFDKYNEIVIEFTKILENNFSHCNLSLFYKNIEALKIKDRVEDLETLKFKLQNKNIRAFYHIKKSNIQLLTLNHYISSLFHELLHLSTRKKVGKVVYCGFSQVDSNQAIGMYLNEGYTEYLNQKYFLKKELSSYLRAKIFAQGIERIVGKNKMEELYFDANLSGLIDELGKYCQIEDAVNLINKIDKFYEKFYANDDEANQIWKEILTTIAALYRIKLSKEQAEGKINENEYRKRKLLYCDEFKEGRIHSENVIVQEYEKYFLIIDSVAHKSYIHMKDSEDIDINDKTNSYNTEGMADENIQFLIPSETLPLEETELNEEAKGKNY